MALLVHAAAGVAVYDEAVDVPETVEAVVELTVRCPPDPLHPAKATSSTAGVSTRLALPGASRQADNRAPSASDR